MEWNKIDESSRLDLSVFPKRKWDRSRLRLKYLFIALDKICYWNILEVTLYKTLWMIVIFNNLDKIWDNYKTR